MEPKWLAIRVAIRLGPVGPDLAATTLPWRRVEPDKVVPVGPEHVAVLTWPAPLLRPEPYEPGDARLSAIVIPDALLERYQAAEREFLAVQAELQVIAKQNGEID